MVSLSFVKIEKVKISILRQGWVILTENILLLVKLLIVVRLI